MSLPYNLDDVRRCPGMYATFPSFDMMTAFLMGIDQATDDEFLKGFHDWLVPKVGFAANLVWSALVLYLAFPGTENARSSLIAPLGEATAFDCLFDNLEEFLAEKQKEGGLQTIQHRYQEWLKSQEWYDETVHG